MPEKQSRSGYFSKDKIIKGNTKDRPSIRKLFHVMKRVFKRNKSEIFYNKLFRYLSPGSKILDVGCGDGSFLSLSQNRFICTGIEISGYLANLAERRNIKVMTGDFLTADFTGEKYDGITLLSLLEHLVDPVRAVKKCFNLLNKGGVLLMKTVNYGCVNRKITGEGWTGFRPPDHVIYFTPSNLKRFLKRAGFSKIRVSAWPFNDNMYCDAWK